MVACGLRLFTWTFVLICSLVVLVLCWRNGFVQAFILLWFRLRVVWFALFLLLFSMFYDYYFELSLIVHVLSCSFLCVLLLVEIDGLYRCLTDLVVRWLVGYL